jgi:membrane fusion protein (multidrug efflux system)
MTSPASDFPRTLRSLAEQRSAGTVLIAIALFLAVLWAAWLTVARITVYALSDTARIELVGSAPPVSSPVVGQVVEARISVGQKVDRGHVLVRLDDSVEVHERAEAQARLVSLERQLDAALLQHAAETQTLRNRDHSRRSAVVEGRQRLAGAQSRAEMTRREAESLQRLHEANLAATLDVSRAQQQADADAATANAQRAANEVADWALLAEQSEQLRRKRELERDVAQLRGEITAARQTVAALDARIERLHLRAPVSGVIGHAATVSPGSFLDEGDVVAVIVPHGKVRVVAFFSPAATLGRVRVGQRARLRLHGFPWSEYGTIPAVVSSVGSEAEDGRVRVELAVRADRATRIPLQHGMPGSAEIAVEKISPGRLILRSVGKLVDASASTPEGQR